MRTLLLAAVAAASFGTAAPASACTFETCPGTSLVCTRVSCDVEVCYYQPSGAQRCLLQGEPS